jgi:membrane-bound serine protease (ClpP class)
VHPDQGIPDPDIPNSGKIVGVKSVWFLPAVWLAAFAIIATARAASTPDAAAPDLHPVPVPVLEIDGVIGPATSRYVVKGIEMAQRSGARLIVLQMDTPGGLDTSMRDIIRAILASTVPVVSYVAPSGARAASAGTYILYASHVAAMAPATNLGAATPVSIGGEAPAPQPTKPKEEPAQSGSAMEHKVVNDAVAYIRGLAELRGRNADWAEQAVRSAATLTASAALKENVVDLVARDVPDLLSQIDGREIHLQNRVVKLDTRHLGVARMKPDWRVELLSVITNPTIAYGLLLIGIYGLLFEGYNPGAVFPGVIGAISLLIALFAFQVLSVNYAGLALVLVGVAMIVAEFFFPTFGSLGLGGLIAFIVGSLILFDSDVPGLHIGLPVIGAVATAGGLVIVAMAWLASRSFRRPVVTGTQGMIGETAEVVEDFSGKGRVRYGGEFWNACCSSNLHAGQLVRITRIQGLTLWVEPV